MKDGTKEVPIIFQPAMVRASQIGRKSHTRRVTGFAPLNFKPKDWQFVELVEGDHNMELFALMKAKDGEEVMVKCPYGNLGMRLWAREMCAIDSAKQEAIYDLDIRGDEPIPPRFKPTSPVRFPRWACRMNAEVVGIRVQRLGEMTDLDYKNEGARRLKLSRAESLLGYTMDGFEFKPSPAEVFQSYWSKRHGRFNPDIWVWDIAYSVFR